MKKDRARDIAEEGFAEFAMWRFCTPKRCREVIAAETRERYSHLSPEKITFKVEDALKDASSLLQNLEAVTKTFDTLENIGKGHIVDAVKFVYCANPQRKPTRNEISLRARAYAMKVYADERTVYRWLREARKLYAHILGVDRCDESADWCKYGVSKGMI